MLHDLNEDSDVTEEEIEEEFGNEIAEIVQANSKTEKSNNVHEDLITRSIEAGESALIVKAADIIDNFNYYTKIADEGGLGYVQMIAKLLLKLKPDDFSDKIFNDLKGIVK